MKIGVVGGTGDCGRGFVLRWAQNHEIIIGSRDPKKAEDLAGEATEILKSRGVDAHITGTDNKSAIQASDLVVLSVPYRFLETVTKDLKDSYSDQIVLSPLVPMCRVEKHFECDLPPQGSVSLLVKDLLPPTVKIVAAFHTIASSLVQDLDRKIDGDVLICGDDASSKEVVASLVKEIPDLRPLDSGPLCIAAQLEGLTPMLLNISRLNRIKNAGIKVVEG